MTKIHVALLLIVVGMAPPAVTAAGQGAAAVGAAVGCCACGMCTDRDRCVDGATLAACSEACAAAACRRVGFSTKGTCDDGCAARPDAPLDASADEEGAR